VQFSEEQAPLLGALDEGGKGAHHGLYYRNPVYRWLHAVVAHLLAEARAAGEIRPVDPVYAADALLALLHIDFFFFQREERGLTSEQIVDGLRRLYLDGLR
jgi:AcrR family transcriptional regulator